MKNTIAEHVRHRNLRCLGHVLKKNDDKCVKIAWNFGVGRQRRKGTAKLNWKTMMEKNFVKLVCTLRIPITK